MIEIPKHRRVRRLVALAASAATLLSVCAGAPAALAQDAAPTPMVSYDLSKDDGNGAIANTAAGSEFGAAQIKNDKDANKAGTYADGALQMDGDEYVKLPDGLLEGKTSATVSMMVRNDDFSISGAQWTYLATLGGSRGANEGNWGISTHNGLYTSITDTANGVNETYFSASENLPTDRFVLLTVTIDGASKTGTIYVNGRAVGSSAVGVLPNQFKAQNWNTIGNSTYPGVGDALFHGAVKSYALYDTALTQSQIIAQLDPAGVADLLTGELGQITVPETAAADFTVKTVTASGSATVKWTSDKPKVISVGSDGVATVTPSADGDETVTLTATLQPKEGIAAPAEPVTKDFAVTVPRALDDKESVARDADALTIENAKDMRSNFSVPTIGANGSTISWKVVKGEATIDGKDQPTVTGTAFRTVKVSRPAAGKQAAGLTLEATVTKGGAKETRTLDVTVRPMPSAKEDNEAYVWVYFTGEDGESQKVSLAASKGNDALNWNNLNTDASGKAEPILVSQFGEKGLRDPFIMRSHDGDKFYMLATDLKVVNGDFSSAQNKGSKYIEIWESTDLVNWGKQRHVKVSTDLAGNTWAPEAYWDDDLGTYVVYWASNLYDTADVNDRTALTYNRMMYATTDDFVNFSEPKVWIDVDRRGQAGAGSIDVTVQKVGDTYYRVYKDENSMTLREEKSKDLTSAIISDDKNIETGYATGLKDSAWQEIGTKVGNGQPNGYGGTFSAGEGPSLFPANKGDVNGYQYYLFADQPDYHGGPNHYVPFATKDITDAKAWVSVGDRMPESQMPLNTDGGRPRHGTVLGVTRAEYQKVLEAYEPSIAVSSVAAMDVTTAPGTAPELPKTAHLTMADGSAQDVEVAWDQVKADDYAKAGTFTVRGVAQDDSRMPVEVTVTVAEGDVESTTIGADENHKGLRLKVASGGEAVFAEPAEVKGHESRRILASPAQGVATLTDGGVRYATGSAAANEDGYPFTVRYTMKDGALIDVTYTPVVVDELGDATHKRASSHDPSVVREGDTYYAFGSHRAWYRSTDLQNWEKFENNLSTDYRTVLAEPWAAWSSQNDQGNSDIQGNMWAPDVVWNPTMKKWCMYLSLNGGGKGRVQKSMIVLLTADHLDGDWTYVAPVVYSGFTDDDVAATDVSKVDGVLQNGKVPGRYLSLEDSGINAIDADVHIDDDGSMWMSYGSWFGGIWMMKLDPSTGLRDYGTTYRTLRNSSDAYYGHKIAGGYNNSGEGASFVHHGDYWYLFLSYGNLGVDGGYQIREFRSKDITGPYVDQNGNPAIYKGLAAGGSGSGMNKTVNRGLRVLGTYTQPGSTEIRAAQGGNEVFVDEDGAMYNVYHSRFVNRTGEDGKPDTATGVDHEMRVQQMVATPDGWLVSTPYEYSGAFQQKKAYTKADVAGDYGIVVNDPTRAYATPASASEAERLADPAIYRAVTVTLHEDGTLGGAATGTWTLDGTTVTLDVTGSTVGNNASRLMGTYTGTLASQPTETGGYALVFGAVGGDVFTDAGTDVANPCAGATAIWGAKQTGWPSGEDPENPSGPNEPTNPNEPTGPTTPDDQDKGGDTVADKDEAGDRIASTGAAVSGIAAAVALLAAAGAVLTLRRRRA